MVCCSSSSARSAKSPVGENIQPPLVHPTSGYSLLYSSLLPALYSLLSTPCSTLRVRLSLRDVHQHSIARTHCEVAARTHIHHSAMRGARAQRRRKTATARGTLDKGTDCSRQASGVATRRHADVAVPRFAPNASHLPTLEMSSSCEYRSGSHRRIVWHLACSMQCRWRARGYHGSRACTDCPVRTIRRSL